MSDARNPRFKDIAGQRFGRLVAVEYDPCVWRSPNGRAYAKWKCLCDCGNATSVSPAKLLSGNTNSCGCYQSEARSDAHRSHGMCGTPEFHAWGHMMSRCYNPKNVQWKNYGGRGISVCSEWRESRAAFLAYVVEGIGLRPSSGHSIDRIDVNGNYEPGNIRWATPTEQRNNQRPKEFCKRGHPFDAENTFYRKGRNQRECRECMRERNRQQRKLRNERF